jgi:hypothetical protein
MPSPLLPPMPLPPPVICQSRHQHCIDVALTAADVPLVPLLFL